MTSLGWGSEAGGRRAISLRTWRREGTTLESSQQNYIGGEDGVLSLDHAVLVLVFHNVLRVTTGRHTHARLLNLVVQQARTHHRLGKHLDALLHVSTQRVHGVEDAISATASDHVGTNVFQTPAH